jgi:hypothetical protein
MRKISLDAQRNVHSVLMRTGWELQKARVYEFASKYSTKFRSSCAYDIVQHDCDAFSSDCVCFGCCGGGVVADVE